MKAIEVKEIVVSALHGSGLGDSIKEAIVLAAEEWRNVKLIHNGQEYRVSVDDLFLCCKKQ